jgi:hypothetical protein
VIGPNLRPLLQQIWDLPGGAHRFDPYSHRCPVHDAAGAPEVRRDNLARYLESMWATRPTEVWIAEAPGHRGSRRTGVPLVPELRLGPVSAHLGIDPPLAKATTTTAPTVRTANAVWEQIETMPGPPLLWNAVLHHPHEPGEPFTNRSPTRTERALFAPLLHDLLELFGPERVVAIGRVAEATASLVHPDVTYVRHPSRGGLGAFRAGIATRPMGEVRPR